MALSIRRNFLRLSELLRERFSEKCQSFVLQEASVGGFGCVSHGVLRGLCTVGEENLLEAPKISHSRCALCDGICSSCKAPKTGELLCASGSLPRSAESNSLRRLP